MKTKVIKVDPDNLNKEAIEFAAQSIREGKLVIIPTETVYGIAVNISDEKALSRLYDLKKRPRDKPLTLHIAKIGDIDKFASGISPAAYRLINKFWPGPLTIILNSRSGTEKIGLRMPDNKIALSIIEDADVPIGCPSANLSGETAATDIEGALKDLDGLVELAIDGGKALLSKESTVVDAVSEPVKILRHGSILKKDIDSVAGKKQVLFVCTGNSCRSVMGEALLNNKLKELNRADVAAISAGTMMGGGLEASTYTKELLAREGIDVSAHRSKSLNRNMVRGSDLILVMQGVHEEIVLQLAPEAKKRVFLLKEFAKINDSAADISDPIGQPIEFYEKVFDTIKQAVDKVSGII